MTQSAHLSEFFMNGPNPCCDLGMSTSLLEQELAERKMRLAQAQADAQRQFLSYADAVSYTHLRAHETDS